MSRRVVTLTVALVTLVAATSLVFILPVPYSTMKPGPSFDTLGSLDDQPLLTFGEGVETYPTEGELAFTTVAVSRAETDINLFSALQAWVDGDVNLVPHHFLYRDGETDDDASEVSAAQLSSSQDSSRAAALRAMDVEVPETVQIADVVEGSPAEGVLEAGDRIVRVQDTEVESNQQVAEVISALDPGDQVSLGIERDGQAEDVTVDTKPADDDPDRAMIGITVGAGFDFPIEIENHIGDRVGGPSAGMMFALAIYDKLTPGALTGGQSVAGTGTITPDGEVGSIGGVQQKMVGAEEGGATIFLVPTGNCAEAAAKDTDMTLVDVATLDDAIDALQALADDPEATVPTCSK
ncbi:YlbL family protein [Aeromicrobium piscarium]|uniref:endopeptidase La n=1 Tax=Aeromicrobium piscarium TaxID=2590901 RepID=A0A554SHD6_9ACTN|nr:PDZ domain-containing protein [Aeromicrobium piscarium]TSD65755.1 PDZ domain-containing protein [Aeromicrobium piscarium]